MGADQVLYRAWRPGKFREMVGQEHVTRALRHAVQRGKLAHAYIFSGPRGTGKTTLARIIARVVNCESPLEGEPCGECSPCRRIPEGTFPDVLELDAASNRGIDEVRSLRDQARYAPIEGRIKVYIIDEVHMLTQEAANALLKTLEEPPPRLLFLLCTTDPQRLPPTVLSRCQRFELRRLSEREILDRLKLVASGEGLDLEDRAAARIARMAQGGMRDALALLEQCAVYAEGPISESVVEEVVGAVPTDELAILAEHLAAGAVPSCLAWLDRQLAAGRDARAVAASLRDLWYEWLRAKAGAGTSAVAPPEGWGLPRVAQGLDRLVEAVRQARSTEDPQLALEVALVELAMEPVAASPPGEWAQLEERVRQLEAKVSALASGEGRSVAVRTGPVEAIRPHAGRPVGSGDEAVWAEVLRRLRDRRASTAAFYAEAAVVEWTASAVRIRFPARFSFHYEQARRPEHKHLAEEVLSQVVGEPRTIQLELDAERS